jgi:hypothetical protein
VSVYVCPIGVGCRGVGIEGVSFSFWYLVFFVLYLVSIYMVSGVGVLSPSSRVCLGYLYLWCVGVDLPGLGCVRVIARGYWVCMYSDHYVGVCCVGGVFILVCCVFLFFYVI